MRDFKCVLQLIVWFIMCFIVWFCSVFYTVFCSVLYTKSQLVFLKLLNCLVILMDSMLMPQALSRTAELMALSVPTDVIQMFSTHAGSVTDGP